MGQRSPTDQHPKDHPPAVDQAQLYLSLHRTDAQTNCNEDARLDLAIRGPHATSPFHRSFDGHTPLALVAAQPNIEAHAPRSQLANVLHMQRAAACPRIDLRAQP